MYRKGKFIGYSSNVYARVDGAWRRLELYLPSATGTYNEPIEEIFYRLVDRMEKGLLAMKFADGVRYQDMGDKMMPTKKKAP